MTATKFPSGDKTGLWRAATGVSSVPKITFGHIARPLLRVLTMADMWFWISPHPGETTRHVGSRHDDGLRQLRVQAGGSRRLD